MNWHALPMLRLLVPLVLGILSQGICTAQTFGIILFFWGVALVSLIIRFNKKATYELKFIFGGQTQLFLFGTALLLCFLTNDRQFPDYITNSSRGNLYIGTVEKQLSNNRFVVDVHWEGSTPDSLLTCRGLLLLKLKQPSADTTLLIGSTIGFQARLNAIKGPLNPKTFDFKQYWAAQGIYKQAWINAERVILLQAPATTSLYAKIHEFRAKAIDAFRKKLSTPQSFAIASALTLGYRNGLDKDLKNAYAQAGAMHVLAVSGLHVGLLYLIIQYLLKAIPKRVRYQNIIKPAIAIGGIWGFAILTGASPSVLRASMLFSLIIIGQALYRRASIFNVLAGSAFLLLCWNPALLFQVGFQLSYLALLGIIIYQSSIYRLIRVPTKLGNYLWKLTAVSVAAQLGVGFISLYYFHQFPVYFWLSGWIVIPAASLILILSILLLCSTPIPFLGEIIGQVLEWIINSMNKLIMAMEVLPAHLITDIWLDKVSLIMLYGLLIGVTIGIQRKRLKPVVLGFSLLVPFSLYQGYQNWSQLSQTEITIYHSPKFPTIDLIEGKTFTSIEVAQEDEASQQYVCKPYRMSLGLKETVPSWRWPPSSKQEFKVPIGIQHPNKRIAILDHPLDTPWQSPMIVDYILVRSPEQLDLRMITERFLFNTLIIDSSLSYDHRKKLIQYCHQSGFNYWDIRQQGAFQIPI